MLEEPRGKNTGHRHEEQRELERAKCRPCQHTDFRNPENLKNDRYKRLFYLPLQRKSKSMQIFKN